MVGSPQESAPVEAKYDRFVGLGPFERQVIDASHQDATTTANQVRRFVERGDAVVSH